MSTGSLTPLQGRVLELLSSMEPAWTLTGGAALVGVHSPLSVRIGSSTILVDSPHEILVNKLCALLGRSELRDLEDVKTLLERGGALERALADAPAKDGGFSPLTLAWTLRRLQPIKLATSAGSTIEQTEELDRFKNELIQRLLAAAGSIET